MSDFITINTFLECEITFSIVITTTFLRSNFFISTIFKISCYYNSIAMSIIVDNNYFILINCTICISRIFNNFIVINNKWFCIILFTPLSINFFLRTKRSISFFFKIFNNDLSITFFIIICYFNITYYSTSFITYYSCI